MVVSNRINSWISLSEIDRRDNRKALRCEHLRNEFMKLSLGLALYFGALELNWLKPDSFVLFSSFCNPTSNRAYGL